MFFQLRKRLPSPTPSAGSSASSTSHNSNGLHNGDKGKSPQNNPATKGSPGTENVVPKFGKFSIWNGSLGLRAPERQNVKTKVEYT